MDATRCLVSTFEVNPRHGPARLSVHMSVKHPDYDKTMLYRGVRLRQSDYKRHLVSDIELFLGLGSIVEEFLFAE